MTGSLHKINPHREWARESKWFILYRWGYWGSKWLSDPSKVTKLVSGWAVIEICICSTLESITKYFQTRELSNILQHIKS